MAEKPLTPEQEKAYLKSPGGEKAIAERAKKLGEKVTKVAKTGLAALEELNITLNKSNAAFATNVDAMNKAAIAVANVQSKNVHLGFTISGLNTNYKELTEGLSTRVLPGFDKSSASLTEQVTRWEKLGIGVKTSVDQFNLYRGVLGKTEYETIRTGRTLNAFAVTTGQSFKRVWADFSSNVGNFLDILDSRRMERSTLLFSTRARAMGISGGELFKVVDQFETLDKAQAVAGRMNTVISALGGNFDALKMSALEAPDRIKYLTETIQSVMPRIRAAGPRASKLYMRSLASSLGVSPRTLRAMASHRPGMELPAIGDLAAGRMPGSMGARAEGEAVRRVTFAADQLTALKDAVAAGSVVALSQAGLVELPKAISDMTKVTGTMGQVIADMGTALAGEGGTAFHKAFKAQFATVTKLATMVKETVGDVAADQNVISRHRKETSRQLEDLQTQFHAFKAKLATVSWP